MNSSEWIEGREERERRAASLENHQRLHRLFVEDRLAFEQERKRAIDDLIDEHQGRRSTGEAPRTAGSVDKRMRHAKSHHNRLVLAQTFFWDHIVNHWLRRCEFS